MKAALRERMKAVRASLSPQVALLAEEHLWSEVSGLSGPVLLYVSIDHELPTRRLIGWMLDAGTEVAIPRIIRRGVMEARRLDSLDDLVPGRFRVPTCDGPVIEPSLVLVPGLAFNRSGGRLGYGAGFYDRWLSAHPARTIGVCFEAQLVDDLPLEPHDHPLDAVLTERGWAKRPD